MTVGVRHDEVEIWTERIAPSNNFTCHYTITDLSKTIMMMTFILARPISHIPCHTRSTEVTFCSPAVTLWSPAVIFCSQAFPGGHFLVPSRHIPVLGGHPAVITRTQVWVSSFSWEYCIPLSFLFRQYRYTAYRQFVRWCWGFLGRHVRVVLPACVVHEIRRSFPAAEYAGFRYPELNSLVM